MKELQRTGPRRGLVSGCPAGSRVRLYREGETLRKQPRQQRLGWAWGRPISSRGCRQRLGYAFRSIMLVDTETLFSRREVDKPGWNYLLHHDAGWAASLQQDRQRVGHVGLRGDRFAIGMASTHREHRQILQHRTAINGKAVSFGWLQGRARHIVEQCYATSCSICSHRLVSKDGGVRDDCDCAGGVPSRSPCAHHTEFFLALRAASAHAASDYSAASVASTDTHHAM